MTTIDSTQFLCEITCNMFYSNNPITKREILLLYKFSIKHCKYSFLEILSWSLCERQYIKHCFIRHHFIHDYWYSPMAVFIWNSHIDFYYHLDKTFACNSVLIFEVKSFIMPFSFVKCLPWALLSILDLLTLYLITMLSICKSSATQCFYYLSFQPLNLIIRISSFIFHEQTLTMRE